MNIPKIRFREFNDEWHEVNLKDIFNYFSTNSLSRDQLSNNGIIKNIHYGDIHRKFSTIVNIDTDVDTYIKDTNYKNKYELCKDYDLIFADASEDYDGIGKVIEITNVSSDTISGLHTILARDSANIFAPKFKGYYFNSPIIHNQIRILANGFKVYGISKETINKLCAKIPSKIEQQKIATTLELLDKKIELQSKKIEDLKLFKLCIRKKIFDNNNKNNKLKLKDLVKCESSNITLNDIENNIGEYPIYGANGFIKNINSFSFSKKYIAIVKDGAGVGRTFICNSNSSILATMNALIPITNYEINYISELINIIKFDKYIVGSGIQHIYFKDYCNEEFNVHETETAEKISKLFSLIDKKIDLLSIKTLKIIKLKKGLMQSMFV